MAHEQGDLAEAESLLTTALSLDPKNVGAQMNLGVTRGDPGSSRTVTALPIVQIPNSNIIDISNSHLRQQFVQVVQKDLGKLEEAERSLKKARLGGGCWGATAWTLLGPDLVGRTGTSSTSSEATVSAPRVWDLLRARQGYPAQRVLSLAESLVARAQALQLDGQNGHAYLHLASVLRAQGKPAEEQSPPGGRHDRAPCRRKRLLL